MGYRMYLGKAKKGAELTKRDEGNSDFLQRDNAAIEQLFELGKYVEWREEGAVNLLGDDHDCELYIVSKEFLLKLIEEYRKNNHQYHAELEDKIEAVCRKFNDDPKSTVSLDELSFIGELRSHFYGKARAWSTEWSILRLEPSDDGNITSSWLYEYSIFNLVHILHTFDWENDDLIYMGY